MTPEERYRELREQSENFENKSMIRHHFIRHIREAVEEANRQCDHSGPCDECIDKFKKQGGAAAYADAAKHFQAQIRTYTGEQVAKALIALRDGKFIGAAEVAGNPGEAGE